jgi:glutamine synthetase
VEAMISARKEANAIESMHARAEAYCDKVKPYFDTIRYHADKLELIVDDQMWVLPKYREMLFLR